MQIDDVRAQASDLYLSWLLAPAAARPALLAFYALEAELLKIPARVSQPMLGLVRVTWWRDSLAKQDTGHPLLAELAEYWPSDAALLADFAETFNLLFEEHDATTSANILKQRAELWAALVARILQVPVPQAHAAACAHYGLIAPESPKSTAKALKVIILLATRWKKMGQKNRLGWLGDVWTAVRAAL